MRFLIHPLFVLATVVAIIFAATDFFIALTVAVILHELAHALMAKHLGAVVSRITLTPFGGALNLQTKILTSHQKSLIYLTGPVASLLFSLLSGVMVWLFPTIFGYLEYLVVANFLVGVINLIPIYPLDGGKVLAERIPAKIIYLWSDLSFVIVLIMALVFKNWWWTFFAIMMLLQINLDFKQSLYADKFNYSGKQKTGKFVRYAVLSSSSLFSIYKMIDDLEQWLLKYSFNETLGQCLK